MNDGDYLSSLYQQNIGKGEIGTHCLSQWIPLCLTTWISSTHYFTSPGKGRPGQTTPGDLSQVSPEGSSTGRKSHDT